MFDSWSDPNSMIDPGIVVTLFLFIFLVFVLPTTIVAWKLYNKAGQPGWAAIIPFYTTYVFSIISKKPIWMVWTAIGLSLVSNLPGFRESGIGALSGIGVFVFYLILLSGFIKQYDAGLGFWILYIFFPFFALFIVNGVSYVGEDTVATPIATATPEGQAITSAPATTPIESADPQPQIQPALTTAEQQPQPVPPTVQQQPQTPPQDQNNQTPPQSNTPINF